MFLFVRVGYIFLVLFLHEMTLARSLHKCDELSETILSQILGAAFNPRYMSISEPDVNIAFNFYKRDTEISFYVDEKYYNEKNSLPAWEYNHMSRKIYFDSKNVGTGLSQSTSERFIRQLLTSSIRNKNNNNVQDSTPWHCNYVIKWIDLGRDYYPRYIRSVECIKKECWYGHYTCKPKTFTINVLKRKKGQCATIKDDSLLFTVGAENIDLWVWEEKAVNFCCDCVIKY